MPDSDHRAVPERWLFPRFPAIPRDLKTGAQNAKAAPKIDLRPDPSRTDTCRQESSESAA